MALDGRWIQIVGLGMLLHITNSCIIGFCTQKEITPDCPSVLFTFAVLNLVTTLNIVPCTIANMNPMVGRLFEVCAGIFISDASYMTVWMPLTKFVVQIPPFLGKVITCLSFCWADTAPVKYIQSILGAENETTAKYTILLTAIMLAVWSAQCSDFLCHLRKLAQRPPSCPCPGQDPCKSRSRSRSRVRRGCSISEFESSD